MMTQANVHGTGIAAFNDGIRDNIKGDTGRQKPPDSCRVPGRRSAAWNGFA